MKKMNIKTIEDVEILYQKFCKKMLKNFKAGVPKKDNPDLMFKWMKKKTNLPDEAASVYSIRFAKQMLTDKQIDQNLEREEA